MKIRVLEVRAEGGGGMGVLDQNFEFWSKFCSKLHLSVVPKSISDFLASFVFFEKDFPEEKHPCTNSVFNCARI